MLVRLFLLFTLVPLVELAVLVEIGQRIGVAPTVGLVVLTGALGAWLARREGARSVREIRRGLEAGQLPTREVFHGLMILVAGAFLVTPGVLTDAAGFLMLVRRVRQRVIDLARTRLRDRMRREGGSIHFQHGVSWHSSWPGRSSGSPRDAGGPGGSGNTRSGGTREDGGGDGGGRVIEM